MSSIVHEIGQDPRKWQKRLADIRNQYDFRDIDFAFHSVPITAKSRKLKVKWTPELADDLKAFHGVDAEEEMVKALESAIRADVDQEILKGIVAHVKNI